MDILPKNEFTESPTEMALKIGWFLLAALSIMIGLYPVVYLFIDSSTGLMSSKTPELLSNLLWNIGFYTHISLGGLALLIGWLQFSRKFRNARLKAHRQIGRVYVTSVLLSALAGIGIGFYATGGPIAAAGFIGLGITWFYTTIQAYRFARAGDFDRHERMMYYSYAATFAAVTLRIWLPFLSAWFGEFIPAYRIVAWLCWLPNLLVAYLLLSRKTKQLA